MKGNLGITSPGEVLIPGKGHQPDASTGKLGYVIQSAAIDLLFAWGNQKNQTLRDAQGDIAIDGLVFPKARPCLRGL